MVLVINVGRRRQSGYASDTIKASSHVLDSKHYFIILRQIEII